MAENSLSVLCVPETLRSSVDWTSLTFTSLRVDADQRLSQVILNQHFVPPVAGKLPMLLSEAKSGGSAVGDSATEDVTDERFDRVRLSEGHAGNLKGVPLPRAGPMAGCDHEQRRVGCTGERLNLLTMFTQTLFNLAC